MDAKSVDDYYDRAAGPVWRELRGGLWHSTGSHRFRGILEKQAIEPNPGLACDDHTWGHSLCRELKGISLFDFLEANWERVFQNRHESYWIPFLRGRSHEPPPGMWTSTIWLAVQREKLPNFVSLSQMKKHWDARLSARWMPHLEACHQGAIPLNACSHAIAVCAVKPREFIRMEMHPFDLPALEAVETKWRTRFADEYSLRTMSDAEEIRRTMKR